jgi:hypothetical protein
MVSELEAHSTIVVVTMVIERNKKTICCEDNSVGTFADLVNHSVEQIGSSQRLCIRLTNEGLVDSAVEG